MGILEGSGVLSCYYALLSSTSFSTFNDSFTIDAVVHPTVSLSSDAPGWSSDQEEYDRTGIIWQERYYRFYYIIISSKKT
jgi:hypothetical protein